MLNNSSGRSIRNHTAYFTAHPRLSGGINKTAMRIHTKTKQEFDAVLAMFGKRNVKWFSGAPATSLPELWNTYKEYTVINWGIIGDINLTFKLDSDPNPIPAEQILNSCWD